MRIGLDGFPLASPRTGIGHYTFELARALAQCSPEDEFELISPIPFPRTILEELEREDAPVNLRAVDTKAARLLRRRWWAIGLPLYLRRARLDLFHGTNYDVPLWSRRRNVVTIHDLSILLHPDKHEAHLARRARRRLPLMVRSASMIISPTRSIKREICAHLGVSQERVAIIPDAPRSLFRPLPLAETVETRRRLGVEDDFILTVGTIEPRKNLTTLVRAFKEITRRMPTRCPQLVIAGREGWLVDELYALIKKADLSERLLLTGYVSDDELCALYSACRVCVYPSLYEGFGLPPLEAMACGAPVVTSNIDAIVETVGEAARLVPPTDVRMLADVIIELLEDEAERRRLSYAGLERAAAFKWEECARQTLLVYKQVVGRRGAEEGSALHSASRT
ncbi:MAG TPA: glycosyltransferase family 1 protein [Pyrinomonadaceae bacterium]|jgi:glycosyltransferase involved in cell wall biosynthesis|nr:glycosyltransferase family 1 protein [Pyrinomonadaceae bacterium]